MSIVERDPFNVSKLISGSLSNEDFCQKVLLAGIVSKLIETALSICQNSTTGNMSTTKTQSVCLNTDPALCQKSQKSASKKQKRQENSKKSQPKTSVHCLKKLTKRVDLAAQKGLV